MKVLGVHGLIAHGNPRPNQNGAVFIMTGLQIGRHTISSKIVNVSLLCFDGNDGLAIAFEMIGHGQMNVLSIPHHHSAIPPKGLDILQLQSVGDDQEVNRLHCRRRFHSQLVEGYWIVLQFTECSSIGSGNGVFLINYILHRL